MGDVARLAVVAIVGPPNAGKSTLFNRLVRAPRAIVDSRPGVTRDRNIATARWGERSFLLVDTGGFEEKESSSLAACVRAQSLLAAEEADAVIALFDGRAGMSPLDRDLVRRLRVLGKAVVYAINKLDTPAHDDEAAEFFGLGLSHVFPISAAHGRGIAELMERLLQQIPTEPAGPSVHSGVLVPNTAAPREDFGAPADLTLARAFSQRGRGQVEGVSAQATEPARRGRAPSPPPSPARKRRVGEGEISDSAVGLRASARAEGIRLAIVGRPNVGKSSLLNRLVGFERAIVDAKPGTTRDTLDMPFRRGDQEYVLVDTAGIRRRPRVHEQVERASVVRALRALERAEVAVLVIDATEGMTDQDARIAGYAWERGRALLFAVNKWDAVLRAERNRARFLATLRDQYPTLSEVPVVFLSALTGAGVDDLFPALQNLVRAHRRDMRTVRLNEVLGEATRAQAPPSVRGKRPRFFYATQTGTAPPAITIFTSHPELVQPAYERFLANAFRQAFGLYGTPLRLHCRESPKSKIKNRRSKAGASNRRRSERRG
jgi:GTP-binding protein